MTELPRGTVTFLFTDIEGSTRLLKRLGPRYAEVVDAQRRILRAAAAGHEGREVDTQRAGGAIAAGGRGAARPRRTRVAGGRVGLGVHGMGMLIDQLWVR